MASVVELLVSQLLKLSIASHAGMPSGRRALEHDVLSAYAIHALAGGTVPHDAVCSGERLVTQALRTLSTGVDALENWHKGICNWIQEYIMFWG